MKDILISLLLLLLVIIIRDSYGRGNVDRVKYHDLTLDELESRVVTYDVFE